MNNVHYLSCPQNNLKATLRELLQLADDGKLKSCAFAGVLEDGEIISGVICEDYIFSLLGALQRVNKAILERIEERSVL